MSTVSGIRLLITTSLSLAVFTGASAQAFTFTEIANTKSSDFTGFQSTAINNLGEVAFTAEAVGQVGIFQGDGGAVSTLIPFTTGLTDIGDIDFNSAGTVAFSKNSIPGIFTSDGVVTTTIISPDTALGKIGFLPNTYTAPDINEAGAIAFRATDFGTSKSALFLAKGGTTTVIAESPEFDILRFSLNNNNEVAFFAISDAAADGDAVFLSENGGAPVPLPDPLGFGTVEGIALNDSGMVAFDTLFLDNMDVPLQGVFTQNGGNVIPIVDTSGSFSSFGRPALNNAGVPVFTAELDTGEVGLFAGPDPVNDRIIAIGDKLFGSTVTSLGFIEQTGLNNSGQLTFGASFADGSTGIYRTSLEEKEPQPIPEPNSVLSLLGIGLVGFTIRQLSRRTTSSFNETHRSSQHTLISVKQQ